MGNAAHCLKLARAGPRKGKRKGGIRKEWPRSGSGLQKRRGVERSVRERDVPRTGLRRSIPQLEGLWGGRPVTIDDCYTIYRSSSDATTYRHYSHSVHRGSWQSITRRRQSKHSGTTANARQGIGGAPPEEAPSPHLFCRPGLLCGLLHGSRLSPTERCPGASRESAFVADMDCLDPPGAQRPSRLTRASGSRRFASPL
jgi:hypothetical protein